MNHDRGVWMLDQKSLSALLEAAKKLDDGFAALPAFESKAQSIEKIAEVLNSTAERLQENYPYFHPMYAGQMLKPPHPVARLAYALAMWINPNNHALDGGRATSAMEKEAVAEIAAMFGWKNFLGHLCGGGTMANLEALWVAGQLHPGKKILASGQAHYTHGRISGVLQLSFETVPCDAFGPDGYEGAREKTGARRCRHSRRNNGHDSHRVSGSAAGNSCHARKTRIPYSCRRGVRRIFRACGES
jgi:tyrosine decarboxylase/aspartate 1-decarboxylase